MPSLFSQQPPLLGAYPPNPTSAFGNQPYPNYGGVGGGLIHPSTLTSLGGGGFYPPGQQAIRPPSPHYGQGVPQVPYGPNAPYTQTQHGYHPMNSYPNIGSVGGSPGYYPGINKPYNNPTSSQHYPSNLYNPIGSAALNPASPYPTNNPYNPSPFPVNAFNPSSSSYPTNSYNKPPLSYPNNPYLNPSSSYPTNQYNPSSSYPSNQYNPSSSYPSNQYNPSSYPSSSYKPIAASVQQQQQQQPYKPPVIPDPFQPVYNQDTSSYNQGLPYKPIVVIESQYSPSTSSGSSSGSYNNNKPYESIVVQSAAHPYKNPTSSSISSSSSYNKPSGGLGSSTYGNRPTGLGTIQEIFDDDVPIYIPNKNPSYYTSAASKVAFPTD